MVDPVILGAPIDFAMGFVEPLNETSATTTPSMALAPTRKTNASRATTAIEKGKEKAIKPQRRS